MKRFLLIAGSILLVFIISSAAWYTSRLNHFNKLSIANTARADKKTFDKLRTQSMQAKLFINAKKYNPVICFFIDMSLESGKSRFFVYDTQNDSILHTALVTHGRCNELWLNGRKYSNEIGSGCTSLGKYKVGKPYYGKFGLAYKLYGLEKTNSNAFNRYVVLHAHECVPEKEVEPYPICQSDGCPTVSPLFIKTLAGIIDNSSKPILLWIYE